MEHYYTSDPASEHLYHRVTFDLKGQTLSFTTDSGVFSRDGVDFGTQLMIESLPPLSGTVLELGCGWGALSIPLALLNPTAAFTCVDVNRRALDLCVKNAADLGVKADIFEADGFASVEGTDYDAIITNPPIRAGKSVYYPWFEESWKRLKPGGLFACVAQKKQGAPSIKNELTRIFGNCEVIARDAGYWIITAVKEVA